MTMPVMDGLKATSTILAREAINSGDVPFTALTANALADHREICKAVGDRKG
jgi:CheY-like chemotaxis protein